MEDSDRAHASRSRRAELLHNIWACGVLVVFCPSHLRLADEPRLFSACVLLGTEVADRPHVAQLRVVRDHQAAPVQAVPIEGDILEPIVLPQCVDAVTDRKAVARLQLAQLAHEVAPRASIGLWDDLADPQSGPCLDLFGTLGGERRVAHHELVEQDPQGPPVHRRSIACSRVDLRSLVLRSTTDGVGAADGRPEEPRQPEVAELGVSLVAQDHVLHLQVAVDDAAAVHVLQGADHASRVESRVPLQPP
mmetsp:Transcript_9860/g.26760  ORF Transcript_9860/g.26760 Transcript_9860/m.26760 type:complete len:249 (-) Transcript_9860:758-1504(-)